MKEAIMKKSGNTILITGGATGIGFGLAEAFLEAGNEVIVCGRRQAKLLEAQKKLPGLHIKKCDVTKDKDRRALLGLVRTKFKRLNVLVNNAGIQRDIDLTRGEGELVSGESEIKVNLEAPIFLSALFIPFLMKKDEAYIINVSSGLGFVPIASMPIYCATKAAVHSFSLSLRHQLSKTGVKIIEVIPPAVDTDLNPQGRTDRNARSFGVNVNEFVSAVMKELAEDRTEIGYSFTNVLKSASREELDKRFRMMNGA
jgi:uncharacterized oxidoreductase